MATTSWRAASLGPAGVLLTLLIVTVQIRMNDSWADGVLLLVAAVPAALVLWEGLIARRDDQLDRAATTVLLVSGLLLTGIAIGRLGQALSNDDFGDSGGTLVWMLLLFTAVTAYCYTRSRAVACLLIGSLAAVALLLATVHWVFQTSDFDVYRSLLTLSFVVLFAAGAAGEGRAATILVGAAGVTVLAMAYATGLAFVISSIGGNAGVGWGWELVALVEGAVLTVYAARQLEPGPGYLAFFVLVLFAVSAAATSDEATLVGWPLALAVATGLAAAWGLREEARAG
jgi:hypothetical protein